MYRAINLEQLDKYLSSDDSPENCMMLSDLDGFIHGILCCPSIIQPEEWMPIALGADPNTLPLPMVQLVADLFGNVAQGASFDPPVVEPIFWQAKEGHVIAMDWCEGFMQAVSLRPKEWLTLTESGSDGHLMTPIMLHLMDDNGNSLMGVAQEDLDEVLGKAAEEIPVAVAGIVDYWRHVRLGSGSTN